MENPAISVLMPVYNGEKYLSEAIDSVLQQTFIDFEFLIINDGSTDSTEQIIREYIKKDNRIRYIKNKQNLGLVSTLNKGLGLAEGTYIARMDADDICHLERFQKQVTFMEVHPEIIICGTSYQTFGATKTTHILPVEYEAIKVGLLFGSCICHPSVLFKTSFIRDTKLQYLPETFPAEDYKIWAMAAKAGCLHNLPEVLLYYREHPTQISTENKQWQKDQTDKIKLEMLEWLSPEFNKEEKQYHVDVFIPGMINDKRELKPFNNWISRLISSNQKKGNFSDSFLKRKLRSHVKITTLRLVHKKYFEDNVFNFKRLLCYWCSGLVLNVAPKQNLKILLKSILS